MGRFIAIPVLIACASAASAATLAITGARVYTSANATPLARATVVITDGRIVSVSTGARIPAGAEIVRCGGCTVLAGFWNSHVHFTEPKWESAADQPAAKLASQLDAMLLGAGFTTVVDTGSSLPDTLALRRRIESGEIPGPKIFTAGTPIFPPEGIPYYVRESTSPLLLGQLTPPRDAREAAAAAEANVRNGADIIKVFTGSWISRGKVLPMPQPIAAAAVEIAHQRQRLVFTHPSSLAGIEVAIASGVDVLAHAPDDTRGVDDAVLRRAVAAHMTMIPTLKLFSADDDIPKIRAVVRRFHELGGELMFGTDTGYLTDYDVSEEFRQLRLTGLSTSEIVAMLTEIPARRFGVQKDEGRVAVGMRGDLTILRSDPASDPAAFSQVLDTIRGGRILHRPQ